MIIAIASKRTPKVEAVKTILTQINHLLGEKPEQAIYLEYEIEGGIEMPRTINELLDGARERVIQLQKIVANEGRSADFYIGLEGGFHSLKSNGETLVFLQSWVYVSNGTAGYFGSSGNIQVPEMLAKEVMEHSRDLGVVIDEFAQQQNVKSKQGTWGVLSRDLITRQKSFEIALLATFAPFYNAAAYER